MQAKILANEGVLTIVFVSSEGSVVPVIQQTSGVSRCNRFFKVEDVDDNEAIKYLIKKGFSKELSEMFVDYVGGRCVYLHCRLIVVKLGPPSNDLHKLSDTQSILMYHSVVKVKKNLGLEFFKIKLQSLICNIVC